MESTWTLKEAATQLGVSRETIRRAVAGGDLPSAWGMEGGRRGHRIAPDQARAWWVAQYGNLVPEITRSEARVEREERGELPGASRGPRGPRAEERVDHEQREEVEAVLLNEDGEEQEERVQHSPGSSAPPRSDDLARALEVASASLRQADAMREDVQRMQHVLHMERKDREELWERVLHEERGRMAAVEREERERRRADHLAAELQSYHRVLAEQAESLAEERALRKAAELATTAPVDQPVATSTLEQLPLPSMESERQGWGHRLRRWFFGSGTQQTG